MFRMCRLVIGWLNRGRVMCGIWCVVGLKVWIMLFDGGNGGFLVLFCVLDGEV